MYSDKYGIEHFKHQLNFSSCTLYSDKDPNPNLKDKAIPKVDWLFIRYKEEDGIKSIDFKEKLSAEYAFHFIGDDGPSGTLNNVSFTFNQDHIDILGDYLIDLTQDTIHYYTIGNKNYIRLDGAYDLEEVELTAEAGNGVNIPKPPMPHPIFSTIFISDDGAKLISAARAITNIQPKEAIFFIEVGEQNYFGSVIRVKLGSEVLKSSPNIFQFIAEITKSFGSDLTPSQLSEIVNEALEERESFFTLISDALEFTGELVKWPLDFVFDGIDEIMGSMIESINSLKLDKNRWEAFVDGEKSKEYKPILPGYEFFSDEKYINEFFNSIKEEYIAPLKQEYISVIKTLEEYPPFDRLLSFKLDEFGLVIFSRIDETLKFVLSSIQEIGALAFEYLNGIIVGIINSLVGAIEGIAFIIKLVFNAVHFILAESVELSSNPTEYIGWLIEVLENILGIFVDLFTLDNFKSILSFFGKAIYKGAKGVAMFLMPDPKTGLLRKFPADDIGYALGFIFGFILEQALYILATGGTGNILKAINLAFKQTKDFVVKSGRYIHAKFKATGEFIIKALQSAKEFIKNLPKTLEAILLKIDEFMTPVNNLIGLTAMLTVDLFELVKRFVSLDDINRFKNLGLEYALASDGRYVEIYNNIETGKQYIVDYFADVNKLGNNLKNKVSKTNKQIKKDINQKVSKYFKPKISLSAYKALNKKVNEALIKWKKIDRRPGVAAILEGTVNGKKIQIVKYSSKGIHKHSLPNLRHPLVNDWLKNIANPKLRSRRTHGKCAEPLAISDYLYRAEELLNIKKGKMTIEQAREALKGSISKAKSIHNNPENKLAHGLHKGACKSCNPLLKHFEILEDINTKK